MPSKTPYVVLLIVMISISISQSHSYAETDTKFTKSEGDKIKDDPIAKNILKNIEIARKQYVSTTEEKKKSDE
ncbi:MAG: hypothetical protein ACREAK_08730, partial [Nitrosarchaeum sp.]